MPMKVPSNKARKKDHNTKRHPMVAAKSSTPLHSGGRNPPKPAKMPKAKR